VTKISRISHLCVVKSHSPSRDLDLEVTCPSKLLFPLTEQNFISYGPRHADRLRTVQAN
jgi:hypothetical protein